MTTIPMTTIPIIKPIFNQLIDFLGGFLYSSLIVLNLLTEVGFFILGCNSCLLISTITLHGSSDFNII